MEQIPTPYAFRNARLTARVSAMRISAPWTRCETFDGSAAAVADKSSGPFRRIDGRLQHNRLAAVSHKESTASTCMPRHLLRRARRTRPVGDVPGPIEDLEFTCVNGEPVVGAQSPEMRGHSRFKIWA